MDEIINQKKRYRLRNKGKTTLLGRRHDAVLMSQNEGNLQRHSTYLTRQQKMFYFVISAQKTKSLVILQELIRSKLGAEDRKIMDLIRDENHRVQINKYGKRSRKYMKSREANKTSACLKNTVGGGGINTQKIGVKRRINKSVIRPLMTYTAEHDLSV